MVDTVADFGNGPTWTWLVAAYFYFTGLSAGSFVLSTLAYVFGMEKFKEIGKVSLALAFTLLVLAPLFLIAELEQPLRFWYLLFAFNPTSAMSWGTLLLIVYPLNCLIYGYFMWTADLKLTKVFGAIGIALAISVHGYTGFILGLVEARALWHTALMPTLFLVSAIVSGIALLIFVLATMNLFLPEGKRYAERLIFDMGKMLVWLIVLDLFLIFTDLLTMAVGSETVYAHFVLLTQGSFSLVFLGVELGLGALVPLILLMTRKTVASYTLASVLVMIGIYAMRYVVVVGGLALPLA